MFYTDSTSHLQCIIIINNNQLYLFRIAHNVVIPEKPLTFVNSYRIIFELHVVLRG